MNVMYSSKLFIFLILVLMATIVTVFSMPTHSDLTLDDDDFHYVPQEKLSGRFLVQQARFIRTCDKYPRVCATKDSAGPDCCKKKCVNVMNDRFNCGKCGRKCKYSEVCCQGWCVNPYWDERHCGKCNHRCKNGSLCRYGMCSYA